MSEKPEQPTPARVPDRVDYKSRHGRRRIYIRQRPDLSGDKVLRPRCPHCLMRVRVSELHPDGTSDSCSALKKKLPRELECLSPSPE